MKTTISVQHAVQSVRASENLVVSLVSNNKSKQKALEKMSFVFMFVLPAWQKLHMLSFTLPCAEAFTCSAPAICSGIAGSNQEERPV